MNIRINKKFCRQIDIAFSGECQIYLRLLVNAIYVLYGFDTSPALRLKLENVKDNIHFQKSSFSFLEIFLFYMHSTSALYKVNNYFI